MKESKSQILVLPEEVGVNIGGASMVGQQRIEAAPAATAESEVNLRRVMDMEGKMILADMVITPEGVVVGDGEAIELEENEAVAEDVVVEAGVLTKAGEEAAIITKILHIIPPSRAIHLPTPKQTFHHSYLLRKIPIPGRGPSQLTQTRQNQLIISLSLRIPGSQTWSPSPQAGSRSRAGLTKYKRKRLISGERQS